jgi:hypothetical protein
VKIGLCIPHTGIVSMRFAESLAALTGYTTSLTIDYNDRTERAELALLGERDGPLDYKRIRAAQRALEWGADYLLFLDSDHVFPKEALVRLMARNCPVIGSNYPTRGQNRPTAYDFDAQPVPSTAAQAEADAVEAVAGLGLGFCLVKAPVFAAIRQPWFQTTIGEAGELVCGEDAHFCNRVRAAGIPILVDHALSVEIGHLGERVFTLADPVSR